MTDEDRATELLNMHRCLDAGAKVWTIAATNIAANTGEIRKDDVMAALGIIFPTPLAEFRQDLIMHEIADIINQYDVSTCGLWHFAHMLLHIIFDEDVPRH